MATTQLVVGIPTLLTQNTIYAMPPKRVLLFCADATPSLQGSNDPTFAASNAAITLTNGQAELGCPFIRTTAVAGVTVTLMSF